jgi:uncharacterized short protein YbdD (DUF466 family)
MRRETEGGRGRQSVAEGGRGWRQVVRRIFGMPDYEAYLEHCRAAGHAPTLGEREYVAQFFEAKGKGARCC